ncbi:MAG TPA: sigma-70 family RNA polymerase sigma factor [Vicinamibacterales bacterium]|nr:sigma-70 family RNA polymerase sigma factor [Vicinamibacterales bacterium]
MDRTQDRALIAGLQSGSHESLRQIADLYGPRVYQLAMRHMKNREDAEEVTQDVLMKVYRKAGSFRGDAALSSWIYRITFNTAMSRLRQRYSARAAEQPRDNARFEAWDQPSHVQGEPADWSHMPDDELLRLELRQAVAAAIRDLPEIYRQPIILRDLEGLTTEEASTRLKLKDETLKSRLHRGRLLLRERLRVFATGLTLHRPTTAYS